MRFTIRVHVLAFFLLLRAHSGAWAQQDSLQYDTTYYKMYNTRLIVTPFYEKEISSVFLSSPDAVSAFKYYTNKPSVFGLRLSYDFLALSASFGLGVLDPRYSKDKGRTRSISFRTTFDTHRFLVDVYYLRYKGLYLSASDGSMIQTGTMYTRPDIAKNNIGISAHYVFNNKRFSARPPFKFDTWQKKSAGSFLTGLEVLYGTIKGDSSLVPTALLKDNVKEAISRLNFISLAPSVEYGYTLVIKKHFFATAIASADAAVTYAQERSSNRAVKKGWRVDPNLSVRGGWGYNSRQWQFTMNYTINGIFLKGGENTAKYFSNYNNVMFTATRRFGPGKRLPTLVNRLGHSLERMGLGFITR